MSVTPNYALVFPANPSLTPIPMPVPASALPQPQPGHQDRDWALWPLLFLTFGILLVAVSTGLVYLLWKHPALTDPVMAAAGVAGVIVAAVVGINRR
ncbi:hypothetical protein [Streptomyces sp. NPDC056045]|uniref:hypothetical protein n=1 Tax=Streptomyces sp. NPDC056045 TaxID=3345691 RepID=UPI0035DAF6EA